jgi:hypothetical protein
VTYEITDFPNPAVNGLGVSFNWTVWQKLRLRGTPSYVNWNKPNCPYRDSAFGPNVFDYYFTQPAPTEPLTPAPPEESVDLELSGHRDWTLARQQAIRTLVEREIFPRSEIRRRVEACKTGNCLGRVLGVHLRGTDKGNEYTPMSDDDILRKVRALVSRLKPDTIFLQTDDPRFVQLLQFLKPVSLSIVRDGYPLHYKPTYPHDCGAMALVDGLLGAACDWYAYTPSNFATISIIMGAHRELIRLNRNCVIEPFHPRVDRVLGL